ncbi:MAG TPA: TetR/AcrR family transcriptional regulator [Streptosporangiaceae bacterium]
MSDERAPTGLARRRRRLTDQETERRMLDAAVDMVNQTGLTVSLEHISLEEVIRAAEVARSAAYRRWPYKDLFFSDLLKELARGATPAIAQANPEAAAATRRVLLEHLDWLRQPRLRTALIAEVFRRQALTELETFRGSVEWRTYIALHATVLGLPHGELREQVQASLTESERELNTGLAGFFEQIGTLVGCRLRPGMGSFEDVARLTTAAIRGMVVMAPANPALSTHTVHANPFGAPAAADWSQPALALASIVTAYLEPDPTVEFDQARIATTREALTNAATDLPY